MGIKRVHFGTFILPFWSLEKKQQKKTGDARAIIITTLGFIEWWLSGQLQCISTRCTFRDERRFVCRLSYEKNKIITSEFYPDCCVEAIYFPSAKLLASSDVTKPGFGRQLCWHRTSINRMMKMIKVLVFFGLSLMCSSQGEYQICVDSCMHVNN